MSKIPTDDNSMSDEGDPYTAMEHHWDESFGYLVQLVIIIPVILMTMIVNQILTMIQTGMVLLTLKQNIMLDGQ